MRRRERRMRSWWHHEQVSIAAAVAAASTTRRNVVEVSYVVPREQKTVPSGGGGVRDARSPTGDRTLHLQDAAWSLHWNPGRRGATAAPCGAPQGRLPALGLPVLAGASGEAVDSSALTFLTAQALEVKRKEEEEEQEKVLEELDVPMNTAVAQLTSLLGGWCWSCAAVSVWLSVAQASETFVVAQSVRVALATTSHHSFDSGAGVSTVRTVDQRVSKLEECWRLIWFFVLLLLNSWWKLCRVTCLVGAQDWVLFWKHGSGKSLMRPPMLQLFLRHCRLRSLEVAQIWAGVAGGHLSCSLRLCASCGGCRAAGVDCGTLPGRRWADPDRAGLSCRAGRGGGLLCPLLPPLAVALG